MNDSNCGPEIHVGEYFRRAFSASSTTIVNILAVFPTRIRSLDNVDWCVLVKIRARGIYLLDVRVLRHERYYAAKLGL